MREFLWEKRKAKRGASRFVVKVIIKIISICINMRQLFALGDLLLRWRELGLLVAVLDSREDLIDAFGWRFWCFFFYFLLEQASVLMRGRRLPFPEGNLVLDGLSPLNSFLRRSWLHLSSFHLVLHDLLII